MKKYIIILLLLPVLLLQGCAGNTSGGDMNNTQSDPASYPELDSLSSLGLQQALLSAYAQAGSSDDGKISAILTRLNEDDPEMSARWSELLEYWDYVNYEMPLSAGKCPEGVEDSSKLCIVVMGYQLNSDGSMKAELVGRLKTALMCAEAYPSAYIAVTGGGTAYENDDATEADCMAQWLIEKGVDADRILIENESLTTSQNALYTGALIEKLGLDITQLLIVTSDYHIRRGIMVFSAQAVLSGSNMRVVGSASYRTIHGFDVNVSVQVSEVSGVAGAYMK